MRVLRFLFFFVFVFVLKFTSPRIYEFVVNICFFLRPEVLVWSVVIFCAVSDLFCAVLWML